MLVVRVGGFTEVPKSVTGGKPLFPAGFAMAGRGGGGGIMGRVFVRFYNTVHITRLQVTPDLDKKLAKVFVRIEGAAPQAEFTVQVAEHAGGNRPETRFLANSSLKLANGAAEQTLDIPIGNVKEWTPDTPNLYDIHVVATVNGELADYLHDRFGMRTVELKPDGFYLNGKKFRLMGANIIGDMGFWRGAPNLFGRDKIKAMLIDPAFRLGANCLRTHTAPIPKWWLDVCDEEGSC